MRFNQLVRKMEEPAAVPPAEGPAKSALDGMRKLKAAKILNNIVAPYTKGFFSDNSWVPVHDMFSALSKANINYNIMHTEYGKNEAGTPNSKMWKLEVDFTDLNGKPQKLYGTVVASGAGPVDDILGRYDLVAYFN